jgi:trigger factor
MQVNVEKLSPVLVEFQVEIPVERVKIEVEKAYAAIQRTARVKGFRPGKAPRHVLAHLYGGRVNADVAQRLVDATLNEALASRQVSPLSQPAIAPTELKPEAAFTYKARFEVRPEVSHVSWQGFEVKRASTTVTDDLVDTEIARLRREHATLRAIEPERPSQSGDVVTFTYRLDVGDKLSVDGEKPQEMETELGTGEVFKEIEQALVGLVPGATADAGLSFSEQHNNPDFRGKKGVFHLTLKDVRERVFPEVDDELAKDCGEDTLEKLRASARARIENELEEKASQNVAEQLVVELARRNPIPVPPSLVDQQAQTTEREVIADANRRRQRVEPNAEMRARIRLDAEMKVRAGLLMAEIAREKDVKVTDDDVEKAYVELAQQSSKNVAKVKAEYRDASKRQTLIGMILEDKILDLIESASVITQG